MSATPLLLALALLGLLPAAAQPAAQPAAPATAAPIPAPLVPLTLEQQRADFAIFRGGLREGHGGLYYFISQPRFEQQCDSVGRTFGAGATVGSYYLKLRYLVTLLGHGHTQLNMPGHGAEYRMSVLQPELYYLPLRLRIINQKLYALADCSAEQTVPPGAEIVGINGVPVARLLATMLRYVPADGRNTTFKYYTLHNYFYFHFLYNLLYPEATDFALQLQGRKQPLRLRGQQPAAIAAAYRARHPQGLSYYGEQLGYQPALAPGVASLRVSSFYKGLIERNGRHFEPFMDSVFRDVKARGTQALLLDLRDNEGGGDGYSETLFGHLTAQPFLGGGPIQVPGRQFRLVQYTRDLTDDVKGYIADPQEFLRDDSTLFLKPKYAELLGEQLRQPAPDAYLGRLYVLTNGGTFSASNNLVRRLYQQRLATGRAVVFVGEENGGDIYSNVLCAGTGYNVELPASHLTVGMPFLCEGRLDRRPPARRLPDHAVQPTIGDVLAGRDAELQYALRLARQAGVAGAQTSPKK